MKALVLEDSRATRTILRQFREELGFEGLEAETAAEALERIEAREPIDVVLVDWNRPGMDGVEFVRVVRARPTLQGMRMMMVTTETDRERVAAALEAGADEYLMKPFDIEGLFEKLVILGLDPRRRAA